MKQRTLLTILLFSIFALSACHRPSAEKSQLKLMFPDANGLDTQGKLVPFAIRIQVTGDGMTNPIYIPWSAESQCPDADCFSAIQDGFVPTAPASFTIDVPTGQRLIQVMALYIDSGTGELNFFYGDASRAFSKAEESVVIPAAALFPAGTVEGKIVGRYLTATNAGPTGTLKVRYKPAGKPGLPLLETVMIAGWFETIGFQGMPLEYSVNGTALFGGAKKLEEFAPTSGATAEIRYPAHSEVQDGSPVQRQAQSHFIGFFGEPAFTNSRNVCVSNNEAPLSNKESVDGTPLYWTGLTASTGAYAILSPGDSDNDCSADQLFATELQFDPAISGDEFGLQVPFQTASEFPYTITESGGLANFTLNLLPGVESAVTGFDAFVVGKEVLQSFRFIDTAEELLKCQAIAAAANSSSTMVRKLAQTATDPRLFSVDPNVFDAVDDGELVLCAKTAAGYLVGRRVQNPSNGGQHEGWLFAEGHDHITENQCFKYDVRLTRFSETTGTKNFDVHFSSDGTDNLGSVYSDSNCTTAIQVPVAFPLDGATTSIYLKIEYPHQYGRLVFAEYGGSFRTERFVQVSDDAAITSMKWKGPQRFSSAGCYPVELELFASNNQAVQVAVATTFNINASPNNFEFHQAADCSAQFSVGSPSSHRAVPFAAGIQSRYIFVKVVTNSVTSVEVKDGGGAQVLNLPNIGGPFLGDKLLASWTDTLPNTLGGDCRQLTITARDASNSPLNDITAGIRLNFKGNAPFHFFEMADSMANCQSSGWLSNPSLPNSGPATRNFYIKFFGGGSGLQIDVTSPDIQNLTTSSRATIASADNLWFDDIDFGYITARNYHLSANGDVIDLVNEALGNNLVGLNAPTGFVKSTESEIPVLSLPTDHFATLQVPGGSLAGEFTLQMAIKPGDGGIVRLNLDDESLSIARSVNDIRIYDNSTLATGSPTFTYALSAQAAEFFVLSIERDTVGTITISIDNSAVWNSGGTYYIADLADSVLGNYSQGGSNVGSNLKISSVLLIEGVQDPDRFERSVEFLKAGAPP